MAPSILLIVVIAIVLAIVFAILRQREGTMSGTKVIEGSVGDVQLRELPHSNPGRGKMLLTFRVTKLVGDENGPAGQWDVELKCRKILGTVNERTTVRVTGKMSDRGVIIAEEIRDTLTNTIIKCGWW